MATFNLLVVGNHIQRQLDGYDSKQKVAAYRTLCLCFNYTKDGLPDLTCICNGRGWLKSTENPQAKWTTYGYVSAKEGFILKSKDLSSKANKDDIDFAAMLLRRQHQLQESLHSLNRISKPGLQPFLDLWLGEKQQTLSCLAPIKINAFIQAGVWHEGPMRHINLDTYTKELDWEEQVKAMLECLPGNSQLNLLNCNLV